MAKLTGPLLSFGARGQIGKTLVASSWRGISTARQYVIPANPRTTAQQTNRTRFAFLRELYKRLPSAPIAAFNAYASGRKFTGMNAFVGENNRLLVGETDLSALEMSPGSGGAFAPTSVSAVAGLGSGTIDVTIVPPADLPDGWTVVRAWAVAVVDQNPTLLFSGPIAQGSDTTAPYVITLTGMGSGVACRVMGFIEYTKPNGQTAYSVSLNAAATSAV